MHDTRWWKITWRKVERLCRAKADTISAMVLVVAVVFGTVAFFKGGL